MIGARGSILVSLPTVAAALTSSSMVFSAPVQVQRTASGPQPPSYDSPLMRQLTDDQKEQVRQLMQSMKSPGASREEIRDIVNVTLQEFDMKLPAPPRL